MGWASGNEVFNPVCISIIGLIAHGKISEQAAENILTELITVLQYQDWDTEDGSLHDFKNHDYVVRAFKECGVSLNEEESEEDDDMPIMHGD